MDISVIFSTANSGVHELHEVGFHKFVIKLKDLCHFHENWSEKIQLFVE